MANTKALSLLVGLAEGVNQGISNYMSVRSARQEIEMRKKDFDTDQKIKKLQIQKLENQLDPAVIKQEKEKLRLETKAQKAQLELTKKNIEEKTRNIQSKLEKQTRELALLDRIARGEEIELAPGVRIKGDIVDLYGPKPGSQIKSDVKTKDVLQLATELAKSEMSISERSMREPTQSEIESKMGDAVSLIKKASSAAHPQQESSESDAESGGGNLGSASSKGGGKTRMEINGQLFDVPAENVNKVLETYGEKAKVIRG